MKTKLKSQPILSVLLFGSALLIMSIASNASLNLAFAQQENQFFAKLLGKNEIPPVSTSATGVANFTLSPDKQSIHYTLSAKNISGVMGAHIHVGTSTQDGPIIVNLTNSTVSPSTTTSNVGMLAKGTITSADIKSNLTGTKQMKAALPHAGMTIGSIRELVSLFTSGNAYVNVHTQQHQKGEIRGQIGPVTTSPTTPSSNMTTPSPSSNKTS